MKQRRQQCHVPWSPVACLFKLQNKNFPSQIRTSHLNAYTSMRTCPSIVCINTYDILDVCSHIRSSLKQFFMPKSYTNEQYFPVWVKPRNKQQLSRYVDSKINKDPKVLLQLKTSMSQLFQACNVPHFTSPTIPLISQPLTLKRKRAQKTKTKNTHAHMHTRNNKCKTKVAKEITIENLIHYYGRITR